MRKTKPSQCGPNEQSIHLRSGNLQVAGSNPDLTVFEPWSSQTNDFKIDTCHFLAWLSALLGQGKDCLAECQDRAIEWNRRSWCWWGVPMSQHYKVAMSVHCHKLVPPTHQACATTVRHSFMPHQITSKQQWCPYGCGPAICAIPKVCIKQL